MALALLPQTFIYVTLFPNILTFTLKHSLIKKTYIDILTAHDKFSCAMVDTIQELTFVNWVFVLQIAKSIEFVISIRFYEIIYSK